MLGNRSSAARKSMSSTVPSRIVSGVVRSDPGMAGGHRRVDSVAVEGHTGTGAVTPAFRQVLWRTV